MTTSVSVVCLATAHDDEKRQPFYSGDKLPLKKKKKKE